ncbi:MAG: cyclophilin-like fold protein [Alloacidobacterium sp.]
MKITLKVGDIAYWSPGPDVAIYYQRDGEKIPNPGIIVIGKLDSGVDAFNVAGSAEVKIEVMHE